MPAVPGIEMTPSDRSIQAAATLIKMAISLLEGAGREKAAAQLRTVLEGLMKQAGRRSDRR